MFRVGSNTRLRRPRPRTPCRLPQPRPNLSNDKGMSPSIWGPLVWRLIHGLAKIYDRDTLCECGTSDACRESFLRFLLVLKAVLPCGECRKSYARFIDNSRDRIVRAFETSEVMVFAYDLHNMVNRKLGKPAFGPFELVQRRSDVWDCEAMDSELLGLCLIVSLNYDSNKELDKAQQYMELIDAVRSLVRAFRPKSRLHYAFEQLPFTVTGTVTDAITQFDLLFYFTHIYKLYYSLDEPVSSLAVVLANRYGLCRT